MRTVIFLVIATIVSPYSYAACTVDELRKLRESGFTTGDISKFCDLGKSAPPPKASVEPQRDRQSCVEDVQRKIEAAHQECVGDAMEKYEEEAEECGDRHDRCLRKNNPAYCENYFGASCYREEEGKMREEQGECEEERQEYYEAFNEDLQRYCP